MALMSKQKGPVEFDPSTYGDAFADVYDDWYGDVSDVEATVKLINDISEGGSVLELGVGTGRLSLPLAALGVRVVGIDSSEAMLTKLRSNDPSRSVTAIRANMAELVLDELFAVVFVAFNTLFNLTTAEEQGRCFAGVAKVLEPGGYFVVEAIVPNLESDSPDRGITPTIIDDGSVVLNVTITDRTKQVVNGQHVAIDAEGSVVLRAWRIRYCSVDELDSMAEAAGFVVANRWETWSKEPFTEESARHITVYQWGQTPSYQWGQTPS